MRRAALLAAAILFAMRVTISHADVFTVDLGTTDTSGTGFTPPADDILRVGPVPVLTGGSPGLNVDGFSFSSPWNESALHFSVDSSSLGLPGSGVSLQAGLAPGTPPGGQQANDIFFTALTGTNSLVFDGDGLVPPTAPTLTLSEPSTSVLGVNGIDIHGGVPPGTPDIFWTVSSTTLYPGGSPADIYVASALPGYTTPIAPAVVPKVYASEASLGLVTGDDVDAVHVYDANGSQNYEPGIDTVLFSLAPGSPSLGGGSGSAADIFVQSPFGFFTIPASSLGLAASDNLNALSAVPEPNALALVGLVGLLCVGTRYLQMRANQTGA